MFDGRQAFALRVCQPIISAGLWAPESEYRVGQRYRAFWPEQLIKEDKSAIKWTHLSCFSFADAIRL